MPRVSRERAQANRDAVVRAASSLLRERGPAGVTIEAASARAGLTRGGFYKQFPSKDDLLAEALAYAVQERRVAIEEAHASAVAPRATLRDWYLSAAHRDNPGSGCAVAALVGEAATASGEQFRAGYRLALDDLLNTVATSDADASRREALADIALMVGALELARATAGTPLSDELLAAARERLANPPVLE